MTNIKKLIEILLDPEADDADRDDAAIYLGNVIENKEVIIALCKVANDQTTDEMIRGTCGESLANIWLKKSEIDFKMLANLKDIAFREALEMIRVRRKEWYDQFITTYPEIDFE